MKSITPMLETDFLQKTFASFMLTSTHLGLMLYGQPSVIWSVPSVIYDQFSHCPSTLARPIFLDRWVVGNGLLRNCVLSTRACGCSQSRLSLQGCSEVLAEEVLAPSSDRWVGAGRQPIRGWKAKGTRAGSIAFIQITSVSWLHNE